MVNYPNNPTLGQRFTLPSGVIMECVQSGQTPRWRGVTDSTAGEDHNELTGREADNCHPISSISLLPETLANKASLLHGHGISDLPEVVAALANKENVGVAAALTADKSSKDKLLATIRSKATYIADFVNNEYKVWESPYGLEPKMLQQALTTSRASDGTVNTPFGVQTRGANIARITYDPWTNLPLGLLSEEQRTNLFLHTEDFNNSVWAKTGATITSDSTLAPDRTMSADTLTTTVDGNFQGRATQSVSGAGSLVCISVYARRASSDFLQISVTFEGGVIRRAFFNLVTGQAGGTLSSGGGGTLLLHTTETFADGYVRCIIAVSGGSSLFANAFMMPVSSDLSVTGVVGNSVILWGAQLEVGSFHTSYNPRGASAVPRPRDQNVITPQHNPYEFTVFAKFTGARLTSTNRALSAGTSSTNRIELLSTGLVIAIAGDSPRSIIYPGGFTPENEYKIAYRFKDGILTLYVNGALIGSTGQSINRTFDSTNIKLSAATADSQASTIVYKYVGYFPRSLPDAECILVTTEGL